MFSKLFLILKHLWLDRSDAERAIPPEVLARVTQRVTASEKRHSGEIRICIEAALPLSYLWRINRAKPLQEVIRERALALFGKLGVWDTEHNNGVLIYVLLAEHAIEIVADRGLNIHASDTHWKAVMARMSSTFRELRYEDGLTQALEETSALLMQHFALPSSSDTSDTAANPNELPDAPLLL